MIFNDVLQVKIVSPQEDVFAGPALAVSSKNSAGNFDVLPEHANFITLIEDQPIYIQKLDRQILTYRFALAIMHVNNNNVSIYTNINQAASPEGFRRKE